MYEGISGFLGANPGGIIIGFVVFIIIAGIVAFIILRKKKSKPVTKEEMEDLSVMSAAELREIVNKRSEDIPQTEVIAAVPDEEVKKSEGEVVTADDVPRPVIRENLVVGRDQKYRAVIKWLPLPGRPPITEFGNRIDKPLGGLFFLEPSCPITGEAYYIKQNEDGSFSPYDPREAAILSDYTPYSAWDALHWDEADGVWVAKNNWIEPISKIFLWVVIIIAVILLIIKLGG